MRRRSIYFCGRHPLFCAAFVAVCFVLLAALHGSAAFLFAPVAFAIGFLVAGWRSALAWIVCGSIAAGVFLLRTSSMREDERTLLASEGVEVSARILKDAREGGAIWRAPAMLLDGPRPGAKVWWEGRGDLPVEGSVVRARGNFRELPTVRNPSEFDQAEWLRSQGMVAIYDARWIPSQVETGRWASFGKWMRSGFRTAVADGLPEDSEEAMVIRAVVIGEPPVDAGNLVAAFRNSGTLHAFSVSGLHVAMVGMASWFVLGWCGVPRRMAVFILIVLVFGYSWITGNSAPAVRSAWMFTVFLGAFVFRRRPDLLNSLGAVLLVAMLWDGRLLFLPGVQLSYGVVAAIALGAAIATRFFSWLAKPELYLLPELMSLWQKVSLYLRRKTAQTLGVSIAASVGSTPLTIYHFGLMTPVSVLAGVVFLPAVFFLLCIALGSAAIHPVLPAGSRLINSGNAWIAKVCVFTAKGFTSVPGGHVQLRGDKDPFFIVYDLDYGAGAACFVGRGDGSVLIDCGDPYGFGRRVAPSLTRQGIIPDSVVISHPDGSHLGGGSEVWETFPIHQVLLPVKKARSPAFREWSDASKNGLKVMHAEQGSMLPMPDDAQLEVLFVPPDAVSNASADERVALYRLHWKGWRILYTSDAGIATEWAVVDTGADLSADVIIVGRHAADLNLSDRFLDAANPQVVIASHSDFPVAERLSDTAVGYWKNRGMSVFHQGETGAVTLRVQADGCLRVEGFLDGSLKILSPR